MTGNTRITGDPKVFGLIYFLGAVITSQGGFRTTEVYSLCSEAKSPKLRCGQFVLPWKLPGRTLPCLLQLLAPPGVAQCPVACTRMTAVPASVVPWLLCVSSLCLFPSYKDASHMVSPYSILCDYRPHYDLSLTNDICNDPLSIKGTFCGAGS